MEWLEQTDRAYKGQIEDAMFPSQIKRMLAGRTIARVDDVTGRPGGPNNDAVTITFTNGSVLVINAYSGGDMTATMIKPSGRSE
jgi:hypothetical protein